MLRLRNIPCLFRSIYEAGEDAELAASIYIALSGEAATAEAVVAQMTLMREGRSLAISICGK